MVAEWKFAVPIPKAPPSQLISRYPSEAPTRRSRIQTEGHGAAASAFSSRAPNRESLRPEMIGLPFANPLLDVVRLHDLAIQHLSHKLGKFLVARKAEGDQLLN